MHRICRRQELIVALLMAWLYCIAALATSARLAEAAVGASPASAHCRVVNEAGGGRSLGSGTLIDVTADGQRGLVLTCAHLFSEGSGQVHVAFPDGQSHGALLIAVDQDADLAALEIARPPAEPAEVHLEIDRQGRFVACGYGGEGRFRCVAGRYAGEAATPGQTSLKTTGAVRSGDSGGGLFDAGGRLVGVVWGQAEGVTYSSAGQPLRRFLSRALGRSTSSQLAGGGSAASVQCPTGQCPLVRPNQRPIVSQPPPRDISSDVAEPHRMAPSCNCGRCPAASTVDPGSNGATDDSTAIGAVLQRIEAMQQALHRAVLLRRLPTVAAGGPLGAALLVAAGAGGWLLVQRLRRNGWTRRRRARGRTANRDPRDCAGVAPASQDRSEATADAATTFRTDDQVEVRQPIERDDREAQQLLRLSQLEGRDPLQDAVAGRLALDRLDEIADGSRDSPHASWADQLRRELRERFNDVAPTKFSVGGAP